MDWLDRSWRQTVAWLGVLPVSVRVGAGAVIAVVVLMLALLARRDLATDYAPLFEDSSFSSAELIQMTAAFRKAGLRGSRIDGRTILVPVARREDYLVALHQADALPGDLTLPTTETPGFNPFVTGEQVKRIQAEADKRKLEAILSGMSGVESVSVQYTHVKKPGFPPAEETRAVVAVRMAEGRQLRLEEVEAIRSTAVAYIPGLDRSDVTITDLNVPRAYAGDDQVLADNYAVSALSRLWETDLQAKIERQLSMIPKAIVAVTAHFDDAPADTGTPAAHTTNPCPVLVTASIGIPDRYYHQLWKQRNPQATAPPDDEQLEQIEQEVMQKVQRTVSAILPPPAVGWETDRQVEVATYESLDQVAGSQPETDGRSQAVMTPLIGLFLALATAGVVWWLVTRRAAPAVEHPVSPTAAGEPEPLGADANAPAATDLNQELQQTVDRDLDAAAKLLHQWLRDAA